MCAVKVSIARRESPEQVGHFASMAAQSSGVEVVEATRIAAQAVSTAASESYGPFGAGNTSHQVAMAKAAVLATRVPFSTAAELVAATCGKAVAKQSLNNGLSRAKMSHEVQLAVAAAGIGPESSSELVAKIAATAAAGHAAAGGAGPQEVRQAAQEATEGIAVDDTNQLLAQVAV
ncbi:unnamed protein product [Symbiodinium natans]|uniref:Uncharacterized protein n=1 Tax=Symbiodinium natans TaxID=878477 RepID=A0A812GVE9_9DINO|nr:unnamed protein product [Symbiodinium natans]